MKIPDPGRDEAVTKGRKVYRYGMTEAIVQYVKSWRRIIKNEKQKRKRTPKRSRKTIP